MRILRIPTLVALMVVAAGTARAEDSDWVECRGDVQITGGDLARARAEGLRLAQRDCVEKKFGAFVVSDTQTKDFQLLKDQVMTSAQGYVTDVQNLDADGGKEENGVMVVRIKAKVSQGKIDEDAKARHLTLSAMKYPRLAVLISEQHLGQAAPSQWWGPQGGGNQAGQVITVDQRIAENTLIGEWTTAGFTFVDMDALAGKLKGANVVSTNPSANDVRTISNLLDADVILFGTSVASKQGDISAIMDDRSGQTKGMVSCKASLSMRVFNTDSGEILATGDAAKTEVRLGDLDCERIATKKATQALAKDLQAKVLTAWNKRAMGQSRVRLTVKGIDFAGLREMKGALSTNYRSVQGVDQKSFRDGVADLDLKVDGGDAEGLAEDISTKGFGKFKVKVVGVTGNTISLEAGK